jgi:hypothetical protein
VISNHTHDDLVLRDRTVHSHRIVAVGRIARNGQAQLTTAVEEEIGRQMQAAGAISKGEWSAHRAKWTNAFGADESINIAAPRIQFSVNGSEGEPMSHVDLIGRVNPGAVSVDGVAARFHSA